MIKEAFSGTDKQALHLRQSSFFSGGNKNVMYSIQEFRTIFFFINLKKEAKPQEHSLVYLYSIAAYPV